ncbi:MAG TPA: TIR domain-containing protein [Pyrinomonadaceae bacterium]|nr:TIR domain-containing protein [Pyrinomonadaceae bacterium]
MDSAPFEYDIFISYGHIDDEDPAGGVKGWVDLLVERLPGAVANHLGYKPKVWRDEQSLRGHDHLRGAIDSGVSRSLLLVPVVSPRYVLSDWCRTELELFCAGPPVAGADSFSSRIFKVVKTPLVLPHLKDKEPESLRDLIGYPFYEMEGGIPREFRPDVGSNKDPKYWDTLRRLGWEMANMLVRLKSAPTTTATKTTVAVPTSPVVTTQTAAHAPAQTAAPVAATSAPSAAAPSKFVYLAETASDLSDERERVRDELRQRGYGVLPEQKLPTDERRKTEEAVRADLARSVLSVHLVGQRYGPAPEDDGRSVVRIQEELAAEREQADPDFRRLRWMPPGLNAPGAEVTDERQKTFLAALQQSVTARAELLQTSVEDLKTRVVEKLAPPAAPAAPPRPSKLKQVYLICENRDRPLVRPIREFLFKHNFEVITWFDQESNEKLTEHHRKYLKECDAALVYYGNADEFWVRKNLEDLMKAAGYGRETDWAASAVFVGSPPNEQKEDFLTHMVPLVIRNFAGFNPEDLRDFVRAVSEADNGGLQ